LQGRRLFDVVIAVFDVSLDGKRLLTFLEDENANTLNELMVLLNWGDARRR
jgi:hypothetical protein